MKYSEEEAKCQKEFFDAGEVWHLYTDENFEAFLLNEADLKATMGLFGLCAERFFLQTQLGRNEQNL